MKISIITPTYNSSKTIYDTLMSIKNQSYKDIEHIIIDGISSDETLEICRKYSPNSILISEKDYGIYDAMNKGIKIAKGDVIGILNSDDFYDNNKIIERIVELFKQDINLSLIYGNLTYISSKNKLKKIRDWISEPYYNEFFEDSKVPPHPSLFVKKEVYNNVGAFNLKFKLAADYEFMFRLFKLYNFKSFYTNHYIVKMRIGGATSKNIINIIKQNLEIYKCWILHDYKIPRFYFFKKIINRTKQVYLTHFK